jgi:hypothetical protein
VRGTLLDIEVGCRGGEQARQDRAGSLKPFEDLHNAHRALWTRLRSGFVNRTAHGFPQEVVVFLIPI